MPKFTLTGVKKMQQRIRQIADEQRLKQKQFIRLEAEGVATNSKQNFVPVDLSVLMNSIQVGDVEEKGNTLQVAISAGGPAIDYAVAVHEHPSGFSPPSWKAASSVTFSPSGRGPKYLERPLLNAVKGMSRRLAEFMET